MDFLSNETLFHIVFIYFVAFLILLIIINGKETLFEGECKGSMKKNKSGVEGFGYDPIFIPIEYDITFAEMTKYQKGKISHRGKSVEKLVDFLHR